METQAFNKNMQTLARSDIKRAADASVGQQGSELTQTKNTEKAQQPSAVTAKKQLNAAIMQSAVDVSAANNSLSLVFKTALAGINDALQETLGDNAIQNAYDSGLDVSAEATAERIVSLSTAFFGSYQEQNPDLSEDEALTKFTDIISSGINTGFAEARDILTALSVLEGDIADNIDLTYNLVQDKLTTFVEGFDQTEDTI
jgi:hypothetical protein